MAVNCARREIVKWGAAGVAMAALPGLNFAAPLESTVRGVKLGITTGSLNPLPEVEGKDPLNLLIDECIELGAANIELANGFFGPTVTGGAVGGQAPAQPTPEYLRSREALRAWRLSQGAIDRFAAVAKKFRDAGLNLFSMSNTFSDDATDEEIDAMFREMQALEVGMFQSNQTRVSMGPRLVPFVQKYKIKPSFHTHSNVNDPNEIASPASLRELLDMSPDFMVCLDIGHFTAGNNDAVAYLREHHERITHIHVKDRKRDNGATVEWGTGDTPIAACLQAIRDNHWPIYALIEREYKGPLSSKDETKKEMDYMKHSLES